MVVICFALHDFMGKNNERMNRNVIIAFAKNNNNHNFIDIAERYHIISVCKYNYLIFARAQCPHLFGKAHSMQSYSVFFLSIFDYCKWMGRDPFMAMRQLVRSSSFVTIKGSEIGTQLSLYWFVLGFLKFWHLILFFCFWVALFWRIAFVSSISGHLSRSFRKWVSKIGVHFNFRYIVFCTFHWFSFRGIGYFACDSKTF